MRKVITIAATAVLAFAATAQAAGAATVGLWHMNETSGTTMVDAAGHDNNGSIHSATLTGSGYVFSKGYVSVPSAANLQPGAANLTATISLKTTQVPASPDWDLFRKGLYTTTGGEWKMEWQPNGKVSCGFKGSSKYAEDPNGAGPAINDGAWHTAACFKTATTVGERIDGVTVWTKTITIGSISPQANIVVAARPGSEYFKGTLREARYDIG